MGVTGLWKLIEPCGQPIPLELLENKVLAVDISIWLHQVVKGYQDHRGSALNNAHLLGLFHRLCKLLFYRIKPIFVFDGKVPYLKLETIAKRNLKRNRLMIEAERIEALLLKSLAREKVVQEALGPNAASELLKASPPKLPLRKRKEDDIDDMFKLPEIPQKPDTSANSSLLDTTEETVTESETESSCDESRKNFYNENLQAIDVKSEYFRNLPTDVRHEILIDIKETRKQSSWGKLHEMPSRGNDFSQFQMKRLLKRRQVQQSIEEVQKEMDGVRMFTMSELETIFSEKGIIETPNLPNTKPLASDTSTRYLLVRDLKKTLETVALQIKEEEVKTENSESCSEVDTKKEIKEEEGASYPNREYEDDLQRAIKMSLEESAVYDEKDYIYEGPVKLNKDQRKQLQTAATGLARAYMIEHAGLNDDNINSLLEHTQADESMSSFLIDGYNKTTLENISEIAAENTLNVDASLIPSTLDFVSESGPKLTQPSKDNTKYALEGRSNLNTASVNTLSNKEQSLIQCSKGNSSSNRLLSQILPIVKDDSMLEEDEIGIISDSSSDSEEENSQLNKSKNTEDKDVTNLNFEEVNAPGPKKSSNIEDADKYNLRGVAGKASAILIECALGKKTLEEHKDVGVISDSSSDSESSDGKTAKNSTKPILKNKVMEIVIDTTKNAQEDDIFSDIFAPPTVEKEQVLLPAPASTNLNDILNDLQKELSEIKNKVLEQDKLNTLLTQGNGESLDFPIHQDQSNDKGNDFREFKKGSNNHIKDNNHTNLPEGIKCDQQLIKSPQPEIPRTDMDNKAQSPANMGLNNGVLDTAPEASNISATTHMESEKVDQNQSTKLDLESDEIIEIIDEPERESVTPPGLKTPSKSSRISDYFDTNYVIKRTQEKSAEKPECVPKVQSPFFVRKTLRSSGSKKSSKRNATDDEDSPPKKTSKSSKTLFDTEKKLDESVQTENGESNNAIKVRSCEELEDLATALAKENKDLETERNRQERMGMTISEKMSSECMELLRLFGVPYIVAPMEAEAQCAFLDAMKLTNGTITDDSDIWLFGGQTVYKNFFDQKKYVLEFKSDNIQKSFNVDRKKLIQLALLVGSDYTTGINGIGTVTALEILAAFSLKENTGAHQPNITVLETLNNFREWWENAKFNTSPGTSIKARLQNKLKNIAVYDGFPSLAVVDAYLSPTVDENREAFSWGTPDAESIREFALMNLGWTKSKTDSILEPVLKRLNEKKSQATIKNYFAVSKTSHTKQLPVSKRVQSAINKMSADYKSDTERTDNKTATRTKQRKRKQPTSSDDTVENGPNAPVKVSRTKNKVPQEKKKSTDIIPQREKDLEENEKKKLLAAEILKKTKVNSKKNKNS